ncbi:hypothetical protein ACFO3O_06120 [Dokdonia ponticola]|uniref:DUF3019 domain-containing protein n=1 Tax=Dokdonia ponticola TaxID=2041041 RepID=A0ABV9HTJ0_9FLAO
MKSAISIIYLCMITSLVTEPVMVGKTFRAPIFSICEEVTGDDSCAGKQVYMEFYFEKENVDVIEVTIDSCGKITSEMIDGFPWQWKKEKYWTLVLGDLERTKYTILENVRLTLQNDTLIGEKLNDAGEVSKEYRFRESKKM